MRHWCAWCCRESAIPIWRSRVGMRVSMARSVMSLSVLLKRAVSALLVRSMRAAASASYVAAAIQDTVLHGQCSAFMAVTARTLSFSNCQSVNLLPVPDNIPDEHAVFTEPLAAACGVLERVTINSDDRVAVIGDGKLGLLCAQVIALTGASVLLIGKHAEKLRIAERRGIETTRPKLAAKRKRRV